MNEKYAPLFTPFKIGNVEIKNRIVQCSMGGTSLFGWLEPCHFDKEAAYFLLQRAQKGVGLILPGMQCVRDTMGMPGRHWLYQNKRMFKQLKEYMVEFHKTGAKLFIQLAGRLWPFHGSYPLDGSSRKERPPEQACKPHSRCSVRLRIRFRDS